MVARNGCSRQIEFFSIMFRVTLGRPRSYMRVVDGSGVPGEVFAHLRAARSDRAVGNSPHTLPNAATLRCAML